MRKDTFGFAVAIALCTATVSATEAKAAEGYWGSGYSHSFRHGAFRHVHQRQRFEPDLDFRQWGGGWWAGDHYCGGWAYQYGYLPTAVTFSAAVNDQGKPLSADGSSGLV